MEHSGDAHSKSLRQIESGVLSARLPTSGADRGQPPLVSAASGQQSTSTRCTAIASRSRSDGRYHSHCRHCVYSVWYRHRPVARVWWHRRHHQRERERERERESSAPGDAHTRIYLARQVASSWARLLYAFAKFALPAPPATAAAAALKRRCTGCV